MIGELGTGNSTPDDGVESELRSRRYVTSGYRNVFHRAFLYGMGLRPADMKNPFAGVAVAHNEAIPGQASVRALGDVAKLALQAVGFTERSFTVPESLQNPKNAIAARELVADSAELVVRGHWYDALVGVGASASACFGLAQTLLRLRVPGLVLIPRERTAVDPRLDAAASVLEALGLGRVVSVEDRSEVIEACRSIADVVHAGTGVPDHVDRLRSEMGARLTGRATSAALIAHVFALAHEAGIVEVDRLLGDGVFRFSVEIGAQRVVGYGGRLVEGEWKAVESVGRGFVLTNVVGRTAMMIPADGVSPVESENWPVLLIPEQNDLKDVVAGMPIGVTRKDTGEPVDVLTTSRVAGCDYPGLVESELNYDRF